MNKEEPTHDQTPAHLTLPSSLFPRTPDARPLVSRRHALSCMLALPPVPVPSDATVAFSSYHTILPRSNHLESSKSLTPQAQLKVTAISLHSGSVVTGTRGICHCVTCAYYAQHGFLHTHIQ